MNLHDVPRPQPVEFSWSDIVSSFIPSGWAYPNATRDYRQNLHGMYADTAYVDDRLTTGVTYRFAGERGREFVDIQSLLSRIRSFGDAMLRDSVVRDRAVFAVSDIEHHALIDWASQWPYEYTDPLRNEAPSFNRTSGHLRIYGVEVVRRGR